MLKRLSPKHWALLALSVAGVTAAAALASAHASEASLRTITEPGGGEVLYGPLEGESSLRGAMISMLKLIRGHFGDRPEIGRFYQARGTGSAATFFTVTANNQGGKRLRGMVIVSQAAPDGPVDAAVMFDDAQHFDRSWTPMMKSLNQAWHQQGRQPVVNSPASGTAGDPRPVPALHRTGFPDGSGSVGLPAGWHLTKAQMGSAWAEGPDGESVALAAQLQAYDPRSPMARQYGNRPGTVLAPCCDLVHAWTAAAERAIPQGGSRPSIRVVSTGPMQGRPGAVLASVEVDYHDGKGPMSNRLQLERLGGMPGAQSWALLFFRLSAPARIADQVGPTLSAIARTYGQNTAMIMNEGAREANQINRTAEARRQIQKQQNDSYYDYLHGVQANSDEQAKRNQAFDNYLLDRAVIVNTDTGAHGTTGYGAADLLVKQFPDHFQYVPTQDFVKATDY
jgi:hypothetical protein